MAAAAIVTASGPRMGVVGATGQGWKDNGRVRTCDRWQTDPKAPGHYCTLL